MTDGQRDRRMRHISSLTVLLWISSVVQSLVAPTFTQGRTAEFEAFKSLEVIGARDGLRVQMGTLWKETDVAMLLLFRSYG